MVLLIIKRLLNQYKEARKRRQMRIKGKKIEGPNTDFIVFPRPDGDVVFKVQAVLDMEPFDKLCPRPKPPVMLRPGGIRSEDVENPRHKAAIQEWVERRGYFIALQSLRATEDLEWDTVDYSKPETWKDYQTELKSAGFSEFEVGRLINKVLEVNGLDEDKMEQARSRFLAMQREQANGHDSQQEGQQNTQSGELVNGSTSSRQGSRI